MEDQKPQTQDQSIKDPQAIETIKEGALFRVPTFRISEKGIENGHGATIQFCKGSKDDNSIHRQEGFFTESLIAVAKEYLLQVNIGDMATRETSTAITKLDEALMWLEKRAKDRKRRGVQQTYKA